MTEAAQGGDRWRPQGRPAVRQHCRSVLFLHWALEPSGLAPLLPGHARVDVFNGSAWVGIVSASMSRVRATFMPPFPGLGTFLELSLRTYVHVDDVPGVWVFSVDAGNPAAVVAARTFFHFPYYHALMHVEQEGAATTYRSHRVHRGAPPADFEAAWTVGAPLEPARPGTIEEFFTERPCLFAFHRGRVLHAPIHHPPWPLHRATLRSLRSTLMEAAGIGPAPSDPILHCAQELALEIWPARTMEEEKGFVPVPSRSGA